MRKTTIASKDVQYATLTTTLQFLYVPWWVKRNGILAKGMTFETAAGVRMQVLDQFDESPGYLLVCRARDAEAVSSELINAQIYFHEPTASFCKNPDAAEQVLGNLTKDVAAFAEEVPEAREILNKLAEIDEASR